MILGNSFWGHDVITGDNPLQDRLTNYDIVQLFGGSHGTVIDKLWGRNIPLSFDTVSHYTSSNYFPEWTPQTYMYAEYEGDYEAGNIKGLTEPILFWNIYRQKVKVMSDGKKVNIGKFEFVDRVPNTIKQYRDYTPVRNSDYQYYLFAQTETQYSIPAITPIVTSDYYGYYLIDMDTKEIFKIDIGVTGGNQSLNMKYSQYDTNNKYNTFQKGVTKFKSGGLGGLLVENNNRDVSGNTIDVLEAFEEFVYRDGIKYLKTRKGEIFNVFLSELNNELINQGLFEQPTLSSFTFREIGEVMQPIEIQEKRNKKRGR